LFVLGPSALRANGHGSTTRSSWADGLAPPGFERLAPPKSLDRSSARVGIRPTEASADTTPIRIGSGRSRDF